MSPRLADPVRAAETEAAIIEAARDILAEGGPDALSMRAVASRVGLSATALYNYFQNKQALVDRVVARGFRRFESYLWEAVNDLPSGGIERMAALGQAYLRFAEENQQYFKVMFTIQPEDPREIEELPAGGGYRILRESVVEGIARGQIRDADPDLIALYVWSHVHGLATLSLSCDFSGECGCAEHEWADGDLSAQKLFGLFGELLANGLRPRDEAADGGGVETEKGNGKHV